MLACCAISSIVPASVSAGPETCRLKSIPHAESENARAKYARQFPKLNLFTIQQAFGGWVHADKAHVADGGSFDQIYTRN